MKYRLVVILAFTISTLSAQDFHGGILAGFTASQVDGDSYAGYDKMGLVGGVYVTRDMTDWLQARMEVRYASKGARNPASEDNTGSYLLALHYIDLPVMASFRIKKYGYLQLGLIPGYMFHANGRDDSGTLPQDYLVDFRKFDLGTLIGANIIITQKISLDVRYSYSIFSIRDLETAGSYYSWFGKIFGNSRGDFNNYLTLDLNYQLK
jgi:hypothetical protein